LDKLRADIERFRDAVSVATPQADAIAPRTTAPAETS
jgi:hypothetical protein